MSNRILLISEGHLKEQSVIEQNVNPKVLSKTIITIQDLRLRPILGAALYEQVLEAVELKESKQAELTTFQRELIYDYIQPFIVFSVLADLHVVNNYKMTNKGVLKLNDNAATSLQASELEHAKDYYDNYAAQYKQRLINFLSDNGVLDKQADTDTTSSAIGWYLEGTRKFQSTTSTGSGGTQVAHTHSISDVTGLEDALNGKQAAGFYVHQGTLISINGVTHDLAGNRTWTIEADNLANSNLLQEGDRVYNGNSHSMDMNNFTSYSLSSASGMSFTTFGGALNITNASGSGSINIGGGGGSVSISHGGPLSISNGGGTSVNGPSFNVNVGSTSIAGGTTMSLSAGDIVITGNVLINGSPLQACLSYVAFLSQASGSAPTADVRENNIPGVTWTRALAGVYITPLPNVDTSGVFIATPTDMSSTRAYIGSSLIELLSYDFPGTTLDTSVLTVSPNVNYSVSSNALTVSPNTGISSNYNNAIATVNSFPASNITIEGKLYVNNAAFVMWGLGQVEPIVSQYGFRAYISFSNGTIFTYNNGATTQHSSYTVNTWYDVKIVKTSATVEFYLRQTGDPSYTLLISSENTIEDEELRLASTFRNSFGSYGGYSTREWKVSSLQEGCIVKTYDENGILSDDILNNTMIEIRTYN